MNALRPARSLSTDHARIVFSGEPIDLCAEFPDLRTRSQPGSPQGHGIVLSNLAFSHPPLCTPSLALMN
jgi:hypothetical protein